jgi:hypothetical protein
MAQSFTNIQAALDTLALTVPGITTNNFVTENAGTNFAAQPDITTKILVRSTLVPNTTTVETLGIGGYVRPNGLYVIDIFIQNTQGYNTSRSMGDAILAVFKPGLILTLANGDKLTIEVSSPSPSLNGGAAKSMGKLYTQQIIVRWFMYVQP